MKIKSFLKKNKLIVVVALAYLTLLIISPSKALASVKNSVYYLLEMLQVLPVIFFLTVFIEACVPKEVILNRFGEDSGFKGNIFSLILGSISAGPIYAAFPISKMLLSKGASVTNIVIILSSWAVVKVPMLLNEVKFLGVDFMIVRWVLTVIMIFVMGYVTSRIVKKKDIPITNERSGGLTVDKDYCIGCGLCVKMLPEYYVLNDNKAEVLKQPNDPKAIESIKQTIEKCPVHAIRYSKQNNA